jgi:hypothetical protein
MNNKTPIGWNKTGIATSPDMAKEMVRAAEAYSPSEPGSNDEVRRVRAAYIAHASPLGTMPPPGSFKEAAIDTLQLLKGNKAPALLDKLGKRLAFERTGSRLYEALLARVEAGPSWEGGPTVDKVASIHADELRHFHLVREWIERLGSDPTVITPSADVVAVASLGLVQVMGDPRIPLRYALDGILIAELTDNEGWSGLIELASALGQKEMVTDFRHALASEEAHLATVRTWVHGGTLADATMDLEEQPGEQQEWYEQVSIH